ncbi:discoidin domain-containing protein, partial [Planotetraspora thailandica]
MSPPTRFMVLRGRSLLAALAAVVAVLLVGYTAVTAPAQAADTLLSQGKTATASSQENAATSASAAVDGNSGTRWSSAFSDPQWLQVDLGASATVSQVVLNWEAAYASTFRIQVSPNGTTWTDIYSTTT